MPPGVNLLSSPIHHSSIAFVRLWVGTINPSWMNSCCMHRALEQEKEMGEARTFTQASEMVDTICGHLPPQTHTEP